MTLEKYLEIIYAIYESFYNQLDEYYKEAKFISSREGNAPIKYIVDKGELKVLVRKTVYSDYENNLHVHVALGLVKSALANKYTTEGMIVYPMNDKVVEEALNYVKEYKELFMNFQERKSFYSGNIRVTFESFEFSKEKENRTLEITLDLGNYKTVHLYVDVENRRLETTDEFYEKYLEEIIIPEKIIPDVIKEIVSSNNFPIEPLKDYERKINLWHPQNTEVKKERSKRRWLIF